MAQEKVLGKQLNIPDVAVDVAADPSAVAALEGSIDHANIVNGGGTNTHAQIDAHITDTTLHFTTIDGLSDVVMGSPALVAGHILSYNGVNWVNVMPASSDLFDDKSPQLGANLDVNTFEITSANFGAGTGTADAIVLTAGSGGTTGGSGGEINLTGGISPALFGGSVNVTGGLGLFGGNATLQGGSGNNTQLGGKVIAFGGNVSSYRGSVTLEASDSVDVQDGPPIRILAGNGHTTAGSTGGDIFVSAGFALSATDRGGLVKITAGSTNGVGEGGGIQMRPGKSDTGTHGTVEVHTANGAPGQGILTFWDHTDNSHNFGNYVALKAPAFVGSPLANLTLTLPELDGANGNVLQTDGSGNLSFATPAAGNLNLDAQANLFAGTGSAAALDGTALDNILLGANAGNAITSGDDNIFLGRSAGTLIVNASDCIAIGPNALQTNVFGANNIAIGALALANVTEGSNVCIGNSSGQNLSGALSNVLIGHNAGNAIAAGASHRNICIGNLAGPTGGVTVDKLFIDNTQTDTPLIGGDLSANTVTINGSLDATVALIAPTYTLGTLPAQVAGGMIFVSDATGSSLTGSQCFSNGTVWIDVTTGVAVA